MNIKEFYTELKKQITFEKTWAEFPVLNDNEILVFEGSDGSKQKLDNLEYLEANSDLHFQVALIMADEGESIFYVTEPGEFEGNVFVNFHDEGLYSIENLLDEEDIEEFHADPEAYIALSFDEKKDLFQFFENKLANSLEDFLAGIKIIDKSSL